MYTVYAEKIETVNLTLVHGSIFKFNGFAYFFVSYFVRCELTFFFLDNNQHRFIFMQHIIAHQLELCRKKTEAAAGRVH